MPELPDVEMYKKSADQSIGSKVVDVIVKDESFIKTTKNSLGRYIKSQQVKKNLRRGKYLFIEMENQYTLVLHFGMTGFLSYAETDSATSSYAKCIFELGNNHKLVYGSKRKLGKVEITNNVEDYIEEHELGPDALEISKKDFLSKLNQSKARIKSFLMNQSVLSGIGNVYADEILFQACIHPGQKAHQLTEQQRAELYKQTGRVMKTAIKKQAEVGRMPDAFLLPKRREGEECPRGKGKIKKIKISGRTGYFCPNCQKKNE